MTKAKKIEDIKISVKHYLNTKLKPHVVHNAPSVHEILGVYPLYVQVVALGQSTRIRSVLGSLVAPELFANFQEKQASDLNKEKSILVDVVRKAIVNSDGKQKPHIEWDKITRSAISSYEFGNIVGGDLRSRVAIVLENSMYAKLVRSERSWQRAKFNDLPERDLTHEELQKASINNLFDEETSATFSDKVHGVISLKGVDDANIISLFLSEYVPSFRTLRSTFKSEFWDLHSYIERIKEEKDIRLITINDWFSGEFNKLFLDVWQDEKALKAIHDGFEMLRRTTHPDIQEFIDANDPSI